MGNGRLFALWCPPYNRDSEDVCALKGEENNTIDAVRRIALSGTDSDYWLLHRPSVSIAGCPSGALGDGNASGKWSRTVGRSNRIPWNPHAWQHWPNYHDLARIQGTQSQRLSPPNLVAR